MYTLGGTDLSIFDFEPVVGTDTDVALTGFLDMPARIGDTFYDWAGEIGIEAYVDASEIFFGGRDMVLSGVIRGIDQYDAMSKVNNIYALIDSFTQLVPFTHNLGSHNVYVDKVITGSYLGNDARGRAAIKIDIPMREPVVPITGAIPAGSSAEFGIDGVSFSSLGGDVLTLEGDRRNRPGPKYFNITSYGYEGYAIAKRSAPELNLNLGLKANSWDELKAKVLGLHALLASPGIRYLTVGNDKIRSVFAKDGLTVTKIHAYSSVCFCVVDIKLTESGIAGTLTDLITVLGDMITYNGDKIQVRI